MFSKKLPFSVCISRDTKIAFFDIILVFFGICLVFSVSFLFLFSDIALFAEYGNILVFILLIPVFIVSGFYAVFRFLMKLPLNAYFSGIMFGISSFLIASLFLSPSLLAMGMGILSEESVALIVSIPAYWLLGVSVIILQSV